MREIELPDQAIERPRLFERIEILALDILDQRHRDGRLVRDFTHDRWDLIEPCHLGCAPASFAGDDLVSLAGCAARKGPRDNRLHNSLRPDRIGKVFKRLLANIGPGLIASTLQQIDRNVP